MARIPELRPRLLAVARRLEDLGKFLEIEEITDLGTELRAIEVELYRRPPVRRAAARSQPLTLPLRRAIVAYANDHPDLSLQEIANEFHVNPGRVSATLAGKRS